MAPQSKEISSSKTLKAPLPSSPSLLSLLLLLLLCWLQACSSIHPLTQGSSPLPPSSSPLSLSLSLSLSNLPTFMVGGGAAVAAHLLWGQRAVPLLPPRWFWGAILWRSNSRDEAHGQLFHLSASL